MRFNRIVTRLGVISVTLLALVWLAGSDRLGPFFDSLGWESASSLSRSVQSIFEWQPNLIIRDMSKNDMESNAAVFNQAQSVITILDVVSDPSCPISLFRKADQLNDLTVAHKPVSLKHLEYLIAWSSACKWSELTMVTNHGSVSKKFRAIQ